MSSEIFDYPYISIGGVGGSGTRLVASIVIESGYQFGNDMNESNDTLSFTLFFKDRTILSISDDEFRYRLLVFLKSLSGHKLSIDEINFANSLSKLDRTQHSASWLSERVTRLSAPSVSANCNYRMGWKEPNTHIVIERLFQNLPAMKYIHVVRNGVDMAYSSNQNQVEFWGMDVSPETRVNPEQSLDWWCKVQGRMLQLRDRYPSRILIFRFEDLLAYPQRSIELLLHFCEITRGPEHLDCIARLIKVERVTQRDSNANRLMIKSEYHHIFQELGYKIS